MKKMIALLLTLVLVVALFGCTGQTDTKNPSDAPASGSAGTQDSENQMDDTKTFTVGFSIITLDIPYYAEMKDTFVKGCEARGWEYMVAEAGMSVEKTLNDCSDMITKGVDALVIASWYGDSLGDTLEQAAKAEIPVFFLNTGGLTDNDIYVGHVVADDYQVGYYAGTWTAQRFLKEGKAEITAVDTTSASTVGRNRVDGYRKGMEDAGVKVEWLNEYITENREQCMAAIEDALTAYSTIDLIYGIGSNNNLGAYDAVDAAQRKDPIIVGWDLSEEDQKLIDANTQFVATLVVSAEFEMNTTLEHVEANAKGENVERLTNYYPDLYTNEGVVTSVDVFGE